MKISIDTKEDSKEEIRKVISMLSHLVGDSAAFLEADKPQQQPQEPDLPQEGLFNLFQEEKNPVEQPEEIKKDPDDKPEIVPY